MEVIDTLQFTQHDGADTGANEDIPTLFSDKTSTSRLPGASLA
jgi:hypothetical protein